MRPIATWNRARDVWETPGTASLFCGHSAVYSETFPTSGMTRNGVAYGLPTWAPPTAGSGSSSSPDGADLLGTPTSRMWKGAGPQGGATQIRNKARGLIEAQVMDLLPTPAASVANDGEDVAHWDARRERIKARGINGNGMGEPLTIAAQRLLPTPRTSDTNGPGLHGTGGMDLRTAATLLPTPRATDGTKGGPNQRGSSGDLMLPSAAAQHATDWGPYAPAIRRWEQVLGRLAPAPTEPNAKGNQRLSPRFAEWMMGVPEGWITGVPISRNEQLKACGNGVVPQQAAAALKDMLAAFNAKETP